jgi:hypothetical protein
MMLAFIRKKASVSIKGFSSTEFLDQVAESGYEPVIHSFKKNLVGRLGLTPNSQIEDLLLVKSDSGLRVGEIYFPSDGTCCYIKVRRTSEFVEPASDDNKEEEDIFADPGTSAPLENAYCFEVGELSPMGGEEGKQLDSLISVIEQNVNASMNWEEVGSKMKGKIKGAGIETPSEKDIELANILRDPRLTPLLDTLQSNEAIIIDEFLAQTAESEQIEYFLDKLFEAGFLVEEIILYDDETEQAIFRAKDRAALKQLKDAGIRSPSGKPIEDMLVKRMAALVPGQNAKLSPSWVAQIFLTNILFKIGMTNKDIKVIESSDDGALIYCAFDGVPILFFLTNSIPNERLTTAYENALDQLENVEVVAFSEMEITEDFINTLNLYTAVANVSTIKSLDNMTAELAGLLENIRRQLAQTTLKEINPLTRVDIAGLVVARMGDQE